MSIAGLYKTRFVLPRVTPENIVELIPTDEKSKDGYVLKGCLDTGEQGKYEFSSGYYNMQYFVFSVSVGPGDITFTGRADESGISGVVIIDNCPDNFEGVRVNTTLR